MKDTYEIVVIDDERIPLESPIEGVVTRLYKTPSAGLYALVEAHRDGERIDELWLDHDMGIADDGEELNIKQIWQQLEQWAHEGFPLDVGFILVHTSNPVEGEQMVNTLSKYYPGRVVRATLPTQE